MKNKTIYIKACFKPHGKIKTIKVPTGEKKKSFFSGITDVKVRERRWVQTGYSDCEIDGEALEYDLQNAITKLNESGYEVQSVTPIISAKYDYKWKEHTGSHNHGGSGYGYGYSYTEGLIVIGKKSSNSHE